MPDIKDNVLESINSMGKHQYRNKEQKLSNSDWHLDRDFHRPYMDIVHPFLDVFFKELSETFKSSKILTHNFWFQQYNENDYHSWHTHSECTYSSVYYVELPYKTATTFKSNGAEFQVEVEEGDYIVFPSCLEHCSKENKSNNRKTVISINLSVFKTDE